MRRYFSHVWAVLCNLLLAMALYTCCRLIFFGVNRSLLEGVVLWDFVRNGWRFDLPAILYANFLYVILMLLPFRLRERKGYQAFTKGLFVAANFLLYAVDMADSVYFAYTNRRTTWTIFREFSGDSNVAGILLHDTLTHWYLLLAGAVMLWILIRCYRRPAPAGAPYRWPDYLVHTAFLAAAPVLMVFGMRGSFDFAMRPIGLQDANTYINRPVEAGLVLNTAFSLIRTADAKPFVVPDWFPDEASLCAEFTPEHPAPGSAFRPRNVVILVLESFSASYSALLTGAQGEEHPGYMPFLDSLMQESLVFRYSFANGRTSIESLPSIMCGIPSFIEPFTLTPYAQNEVSGLARELGRKGYATAFYHGARKESLAIAGFAHASGFGQLFSREDFADESQFDGTWGIWDHAFLPYFKKGIDALPEPFLATVFTVTSHHPFVIPPQFQAQFPEGRIPMHKCISYTDDCLRHFFADAAREPWYENTLFVITGDHTNATDLPEYTTSAGVFAIPILFYAPDGSLRGFRDGIAQQVDIKPTLLGLLDYDEPYFSFGCDLRETADEDTWAVNYLGGVYQYFQDGWLLQSDGAVPLALYRFGEDRLLKDNRLAAESETAARMQKRLSAIVQQHITRMVENRLVIGNNS